MNKILILSLMTFLASSNAFAASSGNCGTGCTYTLDDKGLLTVTGTGENASVDSNKFYGNSQVKNIVIKGSIKTIGTDAFHSIKADSIDMSASQVETIGQGAFYDNYKVSSITFSPSLKSIAYGAFKMSTDVPPIKELILPEGLTTIGNQAFAYMRYVEKVVIPDSVISISSSAFTAWGLGTGHMYHDVEVYCSKTDKSLCDQAFQNDYTTRNAYTNTNGTHDNLIVVIGYTKDGDYYIVDGKKYASFSDMGAGKEYHEVKRIYTVEEATEAAKGNKNTFSIKYR